MMIEMNGIRVAVITWDWKKQVNFPKLNAAMAEVYDGKNLPSIYSDQDMDDWGNDSYAAIITSKPVETKVLQELWGAWWDKEYEGQLDYDVEE